MAGVLDGADATRRRRVYLARLDVAELSTDELRVVGEWQ